MAGIKIQFSFENRDYPLAQVEPLRRSLRYFPDFNLKYSELKPDVLIAHHTVLNDEIIDAQKTIILERADSSVITNENVRRWLPHPNVLAVWKSASCKSLDQMNCGDRYHYHVLGENKHEFSPIASMEKVQAKTPIAMQNMFAMSADQPPNHYHHRPYDVVYVCSPLTGIIKKHRENFHSLLKALPGSNIVSLSKKWPRNEWEAILHNTKVVVSPWGYGEICYRDYDAVYRGCTLVKPDSHWVQTDVLDYYKPCRADGSDLIEVVKKALADWDKEKNEREAARLKLANAFDYWRVAKIIAEAIK